MSAGDNKPGMNRNSDQYGGGGGAAPRQPNSVTQSKVLNIIKNQHEQSQPQPDQPGSSGAANREGTFRQLSLPVAPSGLSADAAEFIPMAMKKPPVQSSNTGYGDGYYYQGQEGDYAYDGESSDYYLGNNFGDLTLEDTFDSDQPYYSSNYSQATIEGRFDLALKILTTNPSNHEEYLKPICEEIMQTSAYDRVAPNIVENLYSQCILEENFRYIGARVCQYLNSSLKMEPNFIKRFVKRCQVDFDKREQLVGGSAEEKKKLRGLGMLLAEVFLNVETSASDGSPQRLGFLPTILIKTIETLLSKPEEANVKCGCQMLKLSGSLIEDVVKSIPDQCIHFESLFEILKTLSTSKEISENAKFHVEKIVKLKDDEWDTSLPASSSNIYNPYAQNSYYGAGGFQQEQDPVYYDSPAKDAEDSGSHLLTEEEEAYFLAWQSDQYDGYKQDPGMGFEMEEAYEEFLNEQAPPSSNYNNYQGSSSGSGSKPSVSTSATPSTPTGDSYRYYNNSQHHQATPSNHHHNQHHHHHQNHYGGSGGGGFYPQNSHYQQQQQQQQQQQHYPTQYDSMPQHQQQYANTQYGHHHQPQQMPPQQQQHHQQQYHSQHQQQYPQQQQQHQHHQAPQQPRYSSHNPPPQNDQYHYRR